MLLDRWKLGTISSASRTSSSLPLRAHGKCSLTRAGCAVVEDHLDGAVAQPCGQGEAAGLVSFPDCIRIVVHRASLWIGGAGCLTASS